MSKEIFSEDLYKIEKLLKMFYGTDEYCSISRLGGLTNHTYKVVMLDLEELVIRIPGEGTEDIINRKNEMFSTNLACKIGIDVELLYFADDGTKISKFIPNAITMSKQKINESKHITQIAEILKKLHSCGVDTKVGFDVFEMAETYEKIIFDNNVSMYLDYLDIKSCVMDIKNEIDSTIVVKKVPCHNDPLCENWVEGNGIMYLIDWEYAGMNDGMWDLAAVSIEADFDDNTEMQLLKEYLNRVPSVIDIKHFFANKIYVDYLWSLWAKARVPYDGKPMEDWALERYSRLKRFIIQYKELR